MLAFRSLAATMLVAALPAQVPAHAVPLTFAPDFPALKVLQIGDSVHLAGGVYYNRSLDGGRTWPVFPPVPSLQEISDVASGPGYLLTCGRFQDFGGGTLYPAVARSTDGGSTWTQPLTLDSYSSTDMRLAIDGANVVAVWLHSFYYSVWTRRSGDGGLTWSPAIRLDQPGGPYGTLGYPTVIGDGPHVQVFWLGTGSTATLLQQESLDGGQTWLTAARTRQLASGAFTLAGAGYDLFLVDGAAAAHVTHNGGVTWSNVAIPGMQATYHVAVDGQTVVVVGGANTAGVFSFLVDVSTDGGVTWQANPWPFVPASPLTARVYAAAGSVYAQFASASGAGERLFHSPDQGATWRDLGGYAHFFAPGPRRNLQIARVALGTGALQYAFVGCGYTLRGSGSPGTGGIAPELHLAGLPHLGATVDFAVGSAVGGSIGLLGVASAPPAGVPFGSATIWLQGPIATATIVTSGAIGAAGAGTAAVAVTVPNVPALVGANLTAQALVVDGAAAEGFTVTNAIEVWMQ